MVIFLTGCASPRAPTGGPDDILPPVIIEEESTPNYQTLFNEEKITITFDEWFTLKDVFTQLVISPLMPVQPKVEQKGKSIVITLPDSLKEETTYTINFGNAISDLNAGNVLENFAFVFSTGTELDSSKLTGKVINAVTLAPADAVWVMLYPVGEDSAVYKRKPEYVAKTNKDGFWSMANIRSDSFAVVSLKDDNLNFLYDQDSELFGWLEEHIYVSTPAAVLPQMVVFPKEKVSGIRDVIHTVPGWMKLIVDAPLPKPFPELSPPLDSAITVWEGDTLHLWYNPEKNYGGEAILNGDTTKIRVSTGTSPVSSPLRITALSGRLHPLAEARFFMRVPYTYVDTSKMSLVNDSLGPIPFSVQTDSIIRRTISVTARWNPVARHTFLLLPGAVTDVWGRMNDTMRLSVVSIPADQFGDLTLSIDGLDSTKKYVVLIKTGELVAERFRIEQQSSTQWKKNGIPAGKYTIEIIEDLNDNGVWDTGDYQTRRQPERKMIFTPDAMRAAWELESKLTWVQ